MPVPNRLYELRKASGRTREDVARAVGISVSHLTKLEESGRGGKEENSRGLRDVHMIAFARTFSVTLDELFSASATLAIVGTVRNEGLVTFDGETANPEQGVLQVDGNALCDADIAGGRIHFGGPRPVEEIVGNGRYALVWTADGSVRIRRVFRGREYGKYDLVRPCGDIEGNIPVLRACVITLYEPSDGDCVTVAGRP